MNKLILIGFLLSQISFFGCATANADDLIREQRIAESPQWNGKIFQNPESVPATEWGKSLKVFWNYFFNKPEGYTPSPTLPAEPFDISQWDGPRDLQFAWLGHSTFLIKVDDKVILTDPIFSKRAGPFGWLSPARYSKTISSTANLPEVDAVLITHNHPDHLDEDSIQALISKTRRFIAPLAVGKILAEWGVSPEKITELDWWQTKSIDDLTITAAPAKHTSERGIFDKNKTLWASYGIRGQKHNLYLSGDSGWHEGLSEIGERLGPFDVAFFEIGAYGKIRGWKEVHYTPEQAVKAHQAVRGKLMVPCGWGTFDLALFPWSEPIERFLLAADQADIEYLTPGIGEVVDPGQAGSSEAWWRTFVRKAK
ncbi:MAG: MBL fold metallo-hydrolase [Desulfobulbaceae bacterium]|nr:MBL fold metallo-hydrolase [Desulfobulbaceae bacterium]